MGFKLAQSTPNKPPLKEETPAPVEAIQEPVAPPPPPEPTPEEIAKKALEEAKRLIAQPLTPALVNAMYELLDEWIDKLALRNHAPGLPLQMIRNDLTNPAGGCRCRAYFHNREKYAGMLDAKGNP
jgi:hypothetical protein